MAHSAGILAGVDHSSVAILDVLCLFCELRASIHRIPAEGQVEWPDVRATSAPGVGAMRVEADELVGAACLLAASARYTAPVSSTKPDLTVQDLKDAASTFAEVESAHAEAALFGVTDGKAVGTYLEHKFTESLRASFSFDLGSSAKGIDFPGINVDVKTTSVRQPQSSCPFTSPRQKIWGLGYDLLVFVYEKTDDPKARAARLDMQHVIFINREQTGDFQMTRGLRRILDNEGNKDDLLAWMYERNLPVDDIEADQIADELLRQKPLQGYLTISNALQWRLQYRRVIEMAGDVEGIERLR